MADMLPSFTVFDVETTGLDPKRGHRITELGAVRIENGQVQREKTFCTFVNPEREIPTEVQQITHIKNEDVSGAPTIMTVLPQFLEFAQGTVLVAHNASFDMSFLETEKEFCWGYLELPEAFCTMKLSQHLWPTAFRHTLDQVGTRLNLEIPKDRHRALPDVLLTADALVSMLPQAKIQTVEQLRKVAGLREAAKTPVGARR